jgi:hypothetical protein
MSVQEMDKSRIPASLVHASWSLCWLSSADCKHFARSCRLFDIAALQSCATFEVSRHDSLKAVSSILRLQHARHVGDGTSSPLTPCIASGQLLRTKWHPKRDWSWHGHSWAYCVWKLDHRRPTLVQWRNPCVHLSSSTNRPPF